MTGLRQINDDFGTIVFCSPFYKPDYVEQASFRTLSGKQTMQTRVIFVQAKGNPQVTGSTIE